MQWNWVARVALTAGTLCRFTLGASGTAPLNGRIAFFEARIEPAIG